MSEAQAEGKKARKPGRVKVKKNNTVLDQLKVEYLPVDQIKPNSYNPNRQSEHDFELLCRSISSDGFTQPIIVLRSTLEVVDGEHRWRACKHLGYAEVPVVLVDMTPEQARISTLRHNRARGSEDAILAAGVLKQLADSGAIEFAQEQLMMDDVEVERLLDDWSGQEEASLIQNEVPEDQLGPKGKGLSKLDQASGNIDLSADQLRAKEQMLKEAKKGEERDMAKKDASVFRLVLFFSGAEAKDVKAVLEGEEGAAANLLRICREEAGVA